MVDRLDMTGKVVVVFGGASGIGASTTELLRQRGATVVVGDMTPGPDDVKVDATDEFAVEALIQDIVAQHGKLDAAANCVGHGGPFAALTDCTTEDYRNQMRLSMDSTFFCTRAELRHMRKRRTGSIVNISSTSGVRGSKAMPVHSAAKHGVIGLSKGAALQVATEGIRINVVCPGRILTPKLRANLAISEEVHQRMLYDQPMERFGTPDEVAEGVCFLLSDAAGFITGEAFQINGGNAALT